jgi:two-component system sensor histidine kinase YesM
VITSVLFLILFWILKNALYKPIAKIEDQIEEILEERYTPGRDFTVMIKSHLLSSRFEQVIIMLRELIEKEYNETILRKQAELNALQGQINPHFLYNTLDTIRGQALWEGIDSIADMTQALAKCLRYCININNDMVTLAEEFENVQNYIKIQKTRFSEKLQFEIDIDKQMDKDILNYKVPKLTIQPIVENAVYHGLEKKKDKGKVTIKVFATDTRLSINIIDNGMGIPIERLKVLNKNLYLGQLSKPNEKSDKKQSIGLYNVNQRIKLYYGDEFGLRIQSVEGSKTNVEIIVPIIE